MRRPHADHSHPCGVAIARRAAARRLRQFLARWRSGRGQRDHRPGARRERRRACARRNRPKRLASASRRSCASRSPPIARRRLRLLNNRELQAAYNALGLSEAAMVQASLPPNPTFSLERIAGGGRARNRGPYRGQPVAACDAAGARRHRGGSFPAGAVSGGIRNLAHRQRSAPRLLPRRRGPRPCRLRFAQARETGQTAAELAKRLGETGAMNKLDQARNQAFYAEMVAQLATARLRAAVRTRAPCARARSLGR